MSKLNPAPRSSRTSLPAALAELSAVVDAAGAARKPGSLLRAVVREALRDGTYAVPTPLVPPDAVIWFD